MQWRTGHTTGPRRTAWGGERSCFDAMLHLWLVAALSDSPACDRGALIASLVDYTTAAQVPGDYVEAGVDTGSSASLVARALNHTGMLRPQGPRRMWLYDAWQGMPDLDPSGRDGKMANKFVGCSRLAIAGCRTQEHVAHRLAAAGIDVASSVVWRKGWFNETFRLPKPHTVAFLHVDGDWYQSVYDTLDSFFDLVAVGGVILLDDFGYWEGCRTAFYDFARARGLYPLAERVGHTQLYFIKGKLSNRDSVRGRTALTSLPQVLCTWDAAHARRRLQSTHAQREIRGHRTVAAHGLTHGVTSVRR